MLYLIRDKEHGKACNNEYKNRKQWKKYYFYSEYLMVPVKLIGIAHESTKSRLLMCPGGFP